MQGYFTAEFRHFKAQTSLYNRGAPILSYKGPKSHLDGGMKAKNKS